jgi:uncharacterized protein
VFLEQVSPTKRQLVLDTNVVLDWLLFRLPTLDPLRDALASGHLVVPTHPLLFEELTRVLPRPEISRYTTNVGVVIDAYQAQTAMTDLAPPLLLDHGSLPNGFPRCRDPDDDKFLAFTYHARVDALVTKDRELLKLRKRARPFGVSILTIDEMLQQLEAR